MDKRKSLISLVLLVLLIFGNFVQATTISFVDAAYTKNGTLTVNDPAEQELSIFTNSSAVLEVNNESAYMLDYQARGLYRLDQEVFFSWNGGNWTSPQFNGLKFYLEYFSHPNNIVMLCWLIIIVMVVLIA